MYRAKVDAFLKWENLMTKESAMVASGSTNERVSDNMLARLINDHRDPYCKADDCDTCNVRAALIELQQLRLAPEPRADLAAAQAEVAALRDERTRIIAAGRECRAQLNTAKVLLANDDNRGRDWVPMRDALLKQPETKADCQHDLQTDPSSVRVFSATAAECVACGKRFELNGLPKHGS